MKGYRLEIQS